MMPTPLPVRQQRIYIDSFIPCCRYGGRFAIT